MKIEKINDFLKDKGAAHTSITDVANITFSSEFRDACKQNMCGKYNRNWMCPPAVGEINYMMDEAKQYDKAVVFQTIFDLEDSYDFEGMTEAKKTHDSLILETIKYLKQLDSSALIMGAGSCTVCAECAMLSGESCKFPGLAFSSLEAYGIAVSELAKACRLNYINGVNTVTYFGLVLFKN